MLDLTLRPCSGDGGVGVEELGRDLVGQELHRPEDDLRSNGGGHPLKNEPLSDVDRRLTLGLTRRLGLAWGRS